MGKPAARVGDQTAHGGTITGPGCATVLIGGKPAAVMGDMHACPMQTPATPPIPHVGAAIVATGMTVLIGGKPAALVGDTVICTGPPDSIVVGEFTVLIGAGGGGGGGGGMGGTAKASEVKAKAVEVAENHTLHVKFVDKSGQPITGVGYTVKTPDGNETQGKLSGQIKKSGLPEGDSDIKLRTIIKAAWSKKEARDGEKVKMKAEAVGMDSSAKATFEVWKKDINRAEQIIDVFEDVSLSGGKAEAEWTYDFGEEDFSENDVKVSGYSSPLFFFIVKIEGIQQRSGMLTYKDFIEIELQNDDENENEGDEDLSKIQYKVFLPNGEVRKGKLDGKGYAKEKDVCPGKVRVEFPDEDEVATES